MIWLALCCNSKIKIGCDVVGQVPTFSEATQQLAFVVSDYMSQTTFFFKSRGNLQIFSCSELSNAFSLSFE